MLPKRLQWAREIQSIGQTGLSYANDPYDIERYVQLGKIAARMMADEDDERIAQLEALFADQVGHTTPKIDVRGAVFRDQTILLVQASDDGLWSLPGGWADPGESPAEAVARETLEESGFEVRVDRLLALYDRDKHPHPPMAFHVYKLFFDCSLLGGEPRTSLETSGVGFFPEDDLPPLSVERVLASQISRLFALHRDPTLPTDFD